VALIPRRAGARRVRVEVEPRDSAGNWRTLRAGLAVLAAGLSLAGCARATRARPPVTAEATISGYSYQEVWQAAVRAAGVRSDIVEQDQNLGIIQADRRPDARSQGAAFHILISPPVAGAAAYRVEVVAGHPGPGREWARQVIRHIRDLLEAGALPPGSRAERHPGLRPTGQAEGRSTRHTSDGPTQTDRSRRVAYLGGR
jgi:hypothetical protein